MGKATGKLRAARALAWLFAASTLLLASQLMAQCAAIYAEGTSAANLTPEGVLIRSVFSPDIIAAHFSRMAWSVWVWLALLLTVLAVGRPQDRSARTAPAAYHLAMLHRRVAASQAMRQEQKKRRQLRGLCAVLCAVCAAAMALYLLDLQHFASRDLEDTVGRMVRYAAPWSVAALAVIGTGEFLCIRSMEREITLAKPLDKTRLTPKQAANARTTRILRTVLYVAALAMVAAGILNGGMRDVLVKAINICTECIGLG
ncbi:MAG: CD1871A family CXXC motif-containing protein [Aristaeellaceae bacterium]